MQGEEIGGPYSLVGTDRWPIGHTLLLLACFTMTVVEVAHQNRVVTTEQERWGRKLEASRSLDEQEDEMSGAHGMVDPVLTPSLAHETF